MKFERISENQIRCTLTSADLSSRHIKLSELAYGSEKARSLFQDMMAEAHYELGFESGNSPLMIEAIPTSRDSIVLIITKVDDPEELDTRFSRFTQAGEEPRTLGIGTDDILELFNRLRESRAESEKPVDKQKKKPVSPAEELGMQIFRFDTLDDVIRAARSLSGFGRVRSTLYKCGTCCRLLLYPDHLAPETFLQLCNMLSEYSLPETGRPGSAAYLQEHGELLLREDALASLAKL